MSWRERGLCWQSEAPNFFPHVGQVDQAAQAKAVCRGCPVTVECLEYALVAFPSRRYDFGIWGGTTAAERQQMRRDRDPSTRTCKRCLTEKPITEFPRSGSGYRRYDCRDCWNKATSPRRGALALVKVHTATKHLDEDI